MPSAFASSPPGASLVALRPGVQMAWPSEELAQPVGWGPQSQPLAFRCGVRWGFVPANALRSGTCLSVLRCHRADTCHQPRSTWIALRACFSRSSTRLITRGGTAGHGEHRASVPRRRPGAPWPRRPPLPRGSRPKERSPWLWGRGLLARRSHYRRTLPRGQGKRLFSRGICPRCTLWVTPPPRPRAAGGAGRPWSELSVRPAGTPRLRATWSALRDAAHGHPLRCLRRRPLRLVVTLLPVQPRSPAAFQGQRHRRLDLSTVFPRLSESNHAPGSTICSGPERDVVATSVLCSEVRMRT